MASTTITRIATYRHWPGVANQWLVLCDHASNRVPAELRDLGLSAYELGRHIAWDIGAADVAQRLAREFDTKWQRGGAPAGQPFVSSPDISALADYTNALNVVRTMQIVPFTRQALLQLAVATLLPIAPLLLTIMPLEQLLKLLLGVVV